MKGIYVPPGRRKQCGEPSAPTASTTNDNSPSSKSMEVDARQINPDELPFSTSSSSMSTAPTRVSAAKQGVYVPPGRREAEEKRVADALIQEERRLADEQRLAEERKVAEDQRQVEENKKREQRLTSTAGALYVPRGRRDLNEKRVAESQSSLEDHPKRVAGTLFDRIEANSKPATSLPHVPSSSSVNSVDSTSSNTYIPSDFDLTCSTVIVRGFPANYSFLARDSFATQYSDKGAMVRWLSNDQELLVVFRNEMTCLSEIHSSTTYAFSVARLCDQTENRDEYLRVARELYSGKKVDRSNTVVANRLIGAALGIRMPPSMVKSSAAAANSKARASSPPRIDAWDD